MTGNLLRCAGGCRARAPSHVEYATPSELHNYGLRAKAFAKEAGAERLIGGQTFVRGYV